MVLSKLWQDILVKNHDEPWLSCQDLAIILASVPYIMIWHDLDKGTMVNHDSARLTMIMAGVSWHRTLGRLSEISFQKLIIETIRCFYLSGLNQTLMYLVIQLLLRKKAHLKICSTFLRHRGIEVKLFLNLKC